MMQELIVDKARWDDKNLRDATGIYVRALHIGGAWESADIATLEPESLLGWLKSSGGDNELAENVVGVLLGYGHLHPMRS